MNKIKTMSDFLKLWWETVVKGDLKDANPDFTQRSHKGDNVVPQAINAHFDPAKHVPFQPRVHTIQFSAVVEEGAAAEELARKMIARGLTPPRMLHHIEPVPVGGMITVKDIIEPFSYGQGKPVVLPDGAQASNDRRPITKRDRVASKEAIHTRQLQMAANCGVPIMQPLFLFMSKEEIDGLLVICKALKEPVDA